MRGAGFPHSSGALGSWSRKVARALIALAPHSLLPEIVEKGGSDGDAGSNLSFLLRGDDHHGSVEDQAVAAPCEQPRRQGDTR
jgi:hypothetical protein